MIQIMIADGKESTWLFCDRCGNGYSWDRALPKGRIVGIARQEGWQMGKKHLCGKCKPKKG